MIKWRNRVVSILMITSLLASLLAGCSGKNNNTPETSETYESSEIEETANILEEHQSNEDENVQKANEAVLPENDELDKEEKLTEVQRNSMNMLNYLTVLSQEINKSKCGRRYLEEVYSSLVNNTSPDAIDSRTLIELNDMLDILERYRMIEEKRERLKYIYEQNRAKSLKEAMPSPLGLLSAVKSTNLMDLAASTAYMAIDSYSSYKAYTEESDLNYLKAGWELDDEENNTLHESRKATFNYMVEMVNEYDLPGELALNEKAIDEFVEWKNKSNVTQKIQFFESNESTYYLLGEYWLTLAENYYYNEDYQKCINAVGQYEELDIQILRKDHGLAKILPLVIVAAEKVLDEKEYINAVNRYVEKIIDNSDQGDWELRYFSAQTYLALYSRTGNIQYMEKAYNIALNNVNYLVDEQKSMNNAYLDEVIEIDIKDDMSKEEKKEIKKYNKSLKEKRVKELSPVYDPLLLNCELLFALAQELKITEIEKEKIDNILHEKNEKVFLTEPLDSYYRFTKQSKKKGKQDIEFDGEELKIPVKFISEEAAIKVTVQKSDKTTCLDDWKLQKVKREKEGDYNSFVAVYKSSKAKKYKYGDNETVYVEITPKVNSEADVLDFQYKTVATKRFFVIPYIEFKRVKNEKNN